MKRIFSIFIALYYLLGVLGLSISVHYCAGEIESVSIVQEQSCCCIEGDMMMSCCGDETIDFEIDADLGIANNIIGLDVFVPQVTFVHQTISTPQVVEVNAVIPQTVLQLIPPKPLWILFQTPIHYA